MVVTYVGTCPYNPELELKNFQQKQAEYEAAWCLTSDPLVLYEALRHATAAGQPAPSWLVTAIGEFLMKGRTDQTAERFKDRMRHVQRYAIVRDYLRQDIPRKRALDRAVGTLETTDARAGWFTIRDSYELVKRDLKRKGRESEFFLLVARCDPTVVPVHVVQRPDGTVAINGVIINSAVRPPALLSQSLQ